MNSDPHGHFGFLNMIHIAGTILTEVLGGCFKGIDPFEGDAVIHQFPVSDNFLSRYILLASVTRLPDSSTGFLRQMTFPGAVLSPVLTTSAFFPGIQSKVKKSSVVFSVHPEAIHNVSSYHVAKSGEVEDEMAVRADDP